MRYLQSIGCLVILLGLGIALFSNAYNGAVDYTSPHERNTWYGDMSAYVAMFVVVVGLVLVAIASFLRESKNNYTRPVVQRDRY